MEYQKAQATSKAEYGSDVLVDLLKALDIEYIAMNPGASFRELHDSIVNYGGNQKPEVILCCHEEIAISIAHGYNKVAARPMAAIVHNIIGLMHATMAIFNSWVDRAPVLVLGATGPMAVEERRPWIDWIHTSLDQGSIVRDYVKWDDLAVSLPSAVDSILRGYQLSMTEPKGPVYICLDVNPQKEKLDKPVAIPDTSRFAPPAPIQGDPAALKEAAELLVEAEHPVVLADYLGRNPVAVESLIELAELLALPVIDRGSMFSFPNTHPLDLTGANAELLREADVVLSLDVFDLYQALTTVDFLKRTTKYIIPETARIIDISLRHFAVRGWFADYGKLQPVDIGISASLSSALPVLTSLCRGLITRRPERANRFQARFDSLEARHNDLRRGWREQVEKTKYEKPVSLPWLAAELWEAVKDEDWVLTSYSLNEWARRLWDWDKPYRFVGSKMGGGLGYGIGHSLGVALAHRQSNRLCIDIQPDGDFLFTSNALWTAAHHHIPLLLVMNNNRSYYNSERHQEVVARARGRPVESKIIGTRIDDPPVDFAKLAQSFGLYGEGPIENPEELHPALERAVRHVKEKKQLALVDVVTQSTR
jgi:thiamine pyrophosphate-dependent acetolactate synthase large subunit-like protein